MARRPRAATKTKAQAAEQASEPEVVETMPVEAAPEAPRGSKTAAVKAALEAHPKKLPKEIAEILQADGWDIKAQTVSVVKSNLKAKKKGRKTAPVAKTPTAPAAAATEPADAISLAALQKAKKLIQDLGGIKEARSALNALSQLLD